MPLRAQRRAWLRSFASRTWRLCLASFAVKVLFAIIRHVAGSASACQAQRAFHWLHDLRIYFRQRVRPANFIVEDLADEGCVMEDAPCDGQADSSLDDLGCRKP